MSASKFCIQQRQREQRRIKKLLIFGFVGSAMLHAVLAYALPRWSFDSQIEAEKPMELILVDKPKPKVEPEPVVEPEPEPVVEPEPEPVVEPEPEPVVEPEPEPVVEPEPEPVVKPEPEPVVEPEPEPVVKPEPKKVLTTPTPAPVENTAPAPSSNNKPTESNPDKKNVPKPVATNSAPPRPEAGEESKEGISCVSNCEPEYPAALEGAEGSAGIKLTIDPNGNVISAELADPDSDSGVNRQALLAARQMQFSSPGDDAASVQVKINFTVEGSEYDRAAREEQEKREQAEQAAKERQEEAARQQQLEAERQIQQEQLEQEQEQKSESVPLPTTDIQPTSKPLPALSKEELEEERLRKFRERINNYEEN